MSDQSCKTVSFSVSICSPCCVIIKQQHCSRKSTLRRHVQIIHNDMPCNGRAAAPSVPPSEELPSPHSPSAGGLLLAPPPSCRNWTPCSSAAMLIVYNYCCVNGAGVTDLEWSDGSVCVSIKLQRRGLTSRPCRVPFACRSTWRSKERRKWLRIMCSTPACMRYLLLL